MNELTFEAVKSAADRLGIEPCALFAVCQVEAAGSGFLETSGRPKILFEAHIFWKMLKQARYSNAQIQELAQQHPSILCKSWSEGRRYYNKDGEKEYQRLDDARAIHEEAALCSASWGAFQIMGFNHKLCGFDHVRDFVEAHNKGIDGHIASFCGFVKANNLIDALARKDWAGFARRYNGPGYVDNRYDEKMRLAYERCVKTHTL